MMLMRPKRQTDGQPKVGGSSRHVTAKVWVGKPVPIVSATDKQSEESTVGVFEDALDKASRPVKGKYAHIPYSSEDFIKEKRDEVKLEDR